MTRLRPLNGLLRLGRGVQWQGKRFATSTTTPFQVFNADTKRHQRNRAARLDPDHSRRTDYLRDEVAQRLIDRFMLINRQFKTVVDFGAGPGHLAKAMMKPCPPPSSDEGPPPKDGAPILSDIASERIDKLIMLDSSHDLLHRDPDFAPPFVERRVVSTMESLPLEPSSVDCVISNLSLHWINDLPGIFVQINQALIPDGLFLAAILGGDTLYELRGSIQLAEQERKGGVSPHISPMASTFYLEICLIEDVRDIGNLLGRANFKLLTIDVEDIVVAYPDVSSLLVDLRASGDSAAHINRPGYFGRDLLLATEAIYREMYGEGENKEELPATYHIIYLIGWKEGAVTPKPLERGSVERGFKKGD